MDFSKLPSGPSGGNLAYSPDRSQIAFSRVSAGVWIVGADGSGLRKLSALPGMFPRWSPDGTALAVYVMDVPSSGSRVAIIDVERATDVILGVTSASVGSDGAWHAAWSPDSQTVAFGSRVASVPPTGYARGDNLVLSDRTGASRRVVTDDAFSEPSDRYRTYTALAWSRHGALAYLRETSPSDFMDGVYLVATDGKDPERISTSITKTIAWSPDGSKLAVGATDGVRTLDVASGVVDRFVPQNLGNLGWSPDGTRLAGTTTTSVVIIEAVSGEALTFNTSKRVDALVWSPNSRLVAIREGDLHSAPRESFIVVFDFDGNRRQIGKYDDSCCSGVNLAW